uniref:Tetraspanin n=1 Tax=Acrobeloides nanus TaxID=290746 RepID=A0A914DL36_9BILA
MMLAGLAMIALLLWIRFDPRFETDLKNVLLNNSYIYQQSQQYFQLYQFKQDFTMATTVSWWVLVGFGIAAAIIGFFGMCGSCANVRAVNGLYMTVLIIMILLEIAVGIFIIVYRSKIRDEITQFISTLFTSAGQSQDAYIIRTRFNCCGDGIPGSSGNMNCSSYNKPCPAAIWERLDFMFMVAGIVLIVIIVLQILEALLACVVVVNSRYRTLQEE